MKTRHDFDIAKKGFHVEEKGVYHSNAMISKELIIENQNSLPKRKLKALRKDQEIITRYFTGDKSGSISKALNVAPLSVYRAVSSFKQKLKRTFQESKLELQKGSDPLKTRKTIPGDMLMDLVSKYLE